MGSLLVLGAPTPPTALCTVAAGPLCVGGGGIQRGAISAQRPLFGGGGGGLGGAEAAVMSLLRRGCGAEGAVGRYHTLARPTSIS